MDRVTIDTTHGTMTALPWHVGKYVALDPSGFNWRCEDAEVDQLIEALTTLTPASFNHGRGIYEVSFIPGHVVIEAHDPLASIQTGKTTILSEEGRLQLIAVLESVR